MISLETAIKLKELGFPQDKLLGYCDLDWHRAENDLIDPNDYDIYHNTPCFRSQCIDEFGEQAFIAAPSFEEVWKHIDMLQVTKEDSTTNIMHYYRNKNDIYKLGKLQEIKGEDLTEMLVKIWINQHEHTTTK